VAGGATTLQDFDDDGEHGAASRMLHLMQVGMPVAGSRLIFPLRCPPRCGWTGWEMRAWGPDPRGCERGGGGLALVRWHSAGPGPIQAHQQCHPVWPPPETPGAPLSPFNKSKHCVFWRGTGMSWSSMALCNAKVSLG
jgi:hypothetical protein